MFSRLRSYRPSHTTVVAYLALFVALGGTAYAAATIGSAQVIDDSLQTQDLKNNSAVRSGDVADDNVANGGLVGADVRPDSLKSSDVASLTGGDVTDDSLKGADVDESSLGEVRSAADAARADDADKLDGLTASEFAKAIPNASGSSPAIQTERVSSIAIASNRDFGDFRVRAPSIANSFQVCNDATAARTFIIYTGGGSTSTDSTRQQLSVDSGACSPVFSTGGDNSDFQVNGPGAVVFGGPSGGFREYDLWAIKR
jgi:hypothetical protein